MKSTEDASGGRPDAVARWLTRVREVSEARALGSTETRDLVPTLLDAIVAPDRPDHEARVADLLGEHLGSRVREGHPLAEIVEELAAVSRAAAACWSKLDDAQRPSPAELDRVLTGLERSIGWVTETYERHMLDDEQRDKRAARLLEREARSAMLRGEGNDRLAERLLGVVLELMPCDACAILLYDAKSSQLVEVAGAGTARAALEREVVDITSTTFPAEVARAERPTTEVEDIATSSLEVSGGLRASGIHAMLGVRLPARSRLFGVLWIGIVESRRFTARETRRLELAGERVLVHLETGHLQADLSATVAALRAERGARETFVSLLAHDLRTPLSNAKLAAQLLAGLPDDEPARRRELTERIARNVERADRMLRDLLDVSRVSAGGTLPVQLAPADLFDVAQAVLAELPGRSAERVRLEVEHVVGTWDAAELGRALENLLSNALKYGDPDQPITIRASSEGTLARLEVHSFGAPLDPAERTRIFDPFVQRAQGRGWGLGLAVVHACAAAHGGRVVVESDPSRGTTFTLELPTSLPT